jgi:phage terminase small subunit
MKQLNPQEQKFIEEYLKHSNGKQSAISAGYSSASAASTACKLLKRPRIAEAIAEIRKSANEKAGYTLEAALLETDRLRDLALADKQHSAVAKYHQQKLEMTGHLDKDVTIKVETMDIRAVLARFEMNLLAPVGTMTESEIAKIVDLPGPFDDLDK